MSPEETKEVKKPPPIPSFCEGLSLKKSQEIKKPLVMKILVNFFFVFYFLAGFFSTFSALMGTFFLLAMGSISGALQVYGMPIFMFACGAFMRSNYRRGNYLKACLAMLPAVFIIFTFSFMWAKSYGPLR